MRHFYILLLSITMFISLQGVKQQLSCCPTLSRFAYKATSWCGRNDYIYLVYANSLWYLNMKLQRKERIQDINRYYLRCGATFYGASQERSISLYISPLHEAVERGSLCAVQMLCEAGADKTLTIKSSILPAEEAEEGCRGCPWMSTECSDEKIPHKIESWNAENNIGLSVVELAEKLIKEPRYSDSQERKQIYQFLKD